MISLLLIVLFVIYIFLLFLSVMAPNNWGVRLTLLCLLLAPLIYKLWDYPVLYFQFQRACKDQGGLQVYIKPEKADRFRYEGGHFFDNNAEGMLLDFSPQLKSVDIQDMSSHQKAKYHSYSVDPKTISRKKDSIGFIITSAPDEANDIYIISKVHMVEGKGRFRTEWLLTRGGRLYAKWTSFDYVWASGLFSSPIGWQCFDSTTSHKYADKELIKLILN